MQARTRVHRSFLLAGVVSALAALGACRSDRPLGPDFATAIAVSSMGGTEGEHDVTDPSVPPVCHGRTATIWYGMPAALVPAGAVVRPVVPGDEHHALPAQEDEDESSGWFIVGTHAPDVIVGSPGRDSIAGGNGDDVICADPSEQHDTHDDASLDSQQVTVAQGEDGEACQGSPGHGGGGPDKVWGGNGVDAIYAGGGPDTIWAGSGDDVVNGGGGPDVIYGEGGDDTLFGGPGPDTLVGGSGNDAISGEAANDTLAGNSGDDVLFGGRGFDLLDGGTGTNVLDPGDQADDQGDSCDDEHENDPR